MRLFDEYIMVDWSGSSNRNPRAGPDTTWVAHFKPDTGAILLENTRNRPNAYNLVRTLLVDAVRRSQRVLVGFDFAYGYPAGLASALNLPTVDNPDTPRWLATWAHIRTLAENPAVGGGDHANTIDRFAIADELNRQVMEHHAALNPGPWWGRGDWTVTNNSLAQLPPEIRTVAPFARGTRSKRGSERRAICREHGVSPTTYLRLRMEGPGFPYGPLSRLRATEQFAAVGNAQETWKLTGYGSVGSQALTGIPYLHKLYTDPVLRDFTRVWPFTTGFSDPAENVGRALVVHAEIFPSCIQVDFEFHVVPDACQVNSLVRRAGAEDNAGTLMNYFSVPNSILNNIPAQQQATSEEGWILFA